MLPSRVSVRLAYG